MDEEPGGEPESAPQLSRGAGTPDVMEGFEPALALAEGGLSLGIRGAGTPDVMEEAVDHALPEARTKNVKMIIKCALKHAVSLDKDQYTAFSARVEGYVNVVSRMMRRASLALLYHTTKLANEGGPVPDLFKEKDTYWKNWLKLTDGFFPEASATIKGAPLNYNALVVQHFSEVKAHLGEVVGTGVGYVACPDHFDQVVAYAATTFETIVCNNAWVPLFPRLARLTKALVNSNGFGELGGLRAFDIMRQIRAREPDYSGWSDAAKDYAEDVRRRLLFDPKVHTCMHDKYGKNLHFRDLLMFNFWMMTRLTELGAKRISLSPVVKVARVHIRLDTKVLLSIAKAACPTVPAVKAFRDLENRHHKLVKEQKPDAPGFFDPDSGDHSMLPKNQPRLEKRSAKLSDKQWLEAKATYELEKGLHDAVVLKVKASDAYKTRKAEYDAYIDAKVRAGSSLFACLPKRRGWEFDGTIMTDGVAVSLQYSKDVVVVEDAGKGKKCARKKDDKSCGDPDYDKNLSTLIEGKDGAKTTIVAGLDPGRANLAMIAFALDERTGKLYPDAPMRKSWSLSRGQYYAESGIFKSNQANAERNAHMKDVWEGLGEEDDDGAKGSLRTADLAQVVTYLARYALIREAWWASALKRRESRSRFQQYIGKRKALDGFFAMVKQQLEALFPGAVIKLGYGSAGQTMKPTGKGETSVPTSGTFKACKRVFKDDVAVVDEFHTTLVGWETGKAKEAVYRLPGERPLTAGKGLTHSLVQLGHIPCKHKMPTVCKRDIGAVKTFREEQRKALKLRRGGRPFEASGAKEEKNSKDAERYPEVRGLRFCPERRLYLDRDRESAVAIARLRTLELLGKLRPSPFHRSFKIAKTNSNQLAVAPRLGRRAAGPVHTVPAI